MGRDDISICGKQLGFNFNSHARVGRDLALAKMIKKLGDFNSHARVGRDAITIIF